MTGFVTATKLAELLDISRGLLRKLPLAPSNPGGKPLKFDYVTVNEFLARKAKGFPKGSPPTIEALIAEQLALLRMRDALPFVPHLTYHTFMKLVARGTIPSIELADGIHRFSLAGVVKEASPKVPGFTPAETCHILGLGVFGWGVVKQSLVKKGLLQIVRDPLHGRLWLVTAESLGRVLGEHLLAPWLGVDEWLEYRLATINDPDARLWLTTQVADMLNMHILEVRKLLNTTQHLDYIWAPAKKERFITPESVWRYIGSRPLVTPDEIAVCFGATPEEVERWTYEGAFACLLPHQHSEQVGNNLHQPCFLWLLRQRYITNNTTPNKWLSQREYGLPLYTQVEVATKVDMTVAEVVELTVSGDAYAIQTPDGEWRFTQGWVRRRLGAMRRTK